MRRPLTISAVLWLATFAVHASDIAAPVTIIGIGDSLLTGHGLPTVSRFPALLERRLDDAGYDATVIDPGFRYTSATVLAWLEDPVTANGPVDLSLPNTVAIIETGSNDCPAGLDLDETRANLDQILLKLSGLGIPVLLVGTAAFDACGADYVAAFERLFVDLSDRHGTLLYPEFRTGALGHPELLQNDQNHPNVAGEVVVVDRMLPIVEQLIARLGMR